MSSSQAVEREAYAAEVNVTNDELVVRLTDGRKISAPLSWYPRLLHGTPEERVVYELTGKGSGIHWPLLDEDLSVAGVLQGNRSGESEASLNRWLGGRKKRGEAR